MLEKLLKILELAKEIDLTRINRAPENGPGILMDAEVIITYPVGNKEIIYFVDGVIGKMAMEGYLITRKKLEINKTYCFRYVCKLPETINIEPVE